MTSAILRFAAQLRLPVTTTYCLAAAFVILPINIGPTYNGTIGSSEASARSPGTLSGTAMRTRFIVGLKRSVPFNVFSLSNPNRVIIDLSSDRLQLPPAPRGRQVGLVRSFRAGRSGPGKTRIVINVSEPVIVEKASISKTGGWRGMHHLALEIVPVAAARRTTLVKKIRPSWMSASADRLSRLGARNVQPPLPKRALNPRLRRARSAKQVIVIDPGHGGYDSGAHKNGAVEKNVVLAFAKELRRHLQASGGYRVLMTRDKDVFVPLGDRVAFAEKHKAALFIAVHADYAGSSARGATIYSLRSSTARQLRRSVGRVSAAEVLSRKERIQIKRATLGNVSFVQNILADFASREAQMTQAKTDVFTQTVVRFMGKTTMMRAKPHRTAGFRVLKTAKMPSVLIELAYVTNRKDAARLKSKAWRRKVAGSIAKAVYNYFENTQVSLLK